MRRFLLACTAAAALGCQSTAPPAVKSDPVSDAAYPRVVGLDTMDKVLAAGDPVVTRADSGAMSVSVPVRALRNRDVRAQYRFRFLDDRGRPVGPQPDWQYKTLPGRASEFLEGTALDPAAVDWRLEVRPTR